MDYAPSQSMVEAEVYWNCDSPTPTAWRYCQAPCTSSDSQRRPLQTEEKTHKKVKTSLFDDDVKSFETARKIISKFVKCNEHVSDVNSSLDLIFERSGNGEQLASTKLTVPCHETHGSDIWEDDLFANASLLEKADEVLSRQANATSTPARNVKKLAGDGATCSPVLRSHKKPKQHGNDFQESSSESPEEFKTAEACLEFFLSASPRPHDVTPENRVDPIATCKMQRTPEARSSAIRSLRRNRKSPDTPQRQATNGLSCSTSKHWSTTAIPERAASEWRGTATQPCSSAEPTPRDSIATDDKSAVVAEASVQAASDAVDSLTRFNRKNLAASSQSHPDAVSGGEQTNYHNSISEDILSQLIMDDSWALTCTSAKPAEIPAAARAVSDSHHHNLRSHPFEADKIQTPSTTVSNGTAPLAKTVAHQPQKNFRFGRTSNTVSKDVTKQGCPTFPAVTNNSRKPLSAEGTAPSSSSTDGKFGSKSSVFPFLSRTHNEPTCAGAQRSLRSNTVPARATAQAKLSDSLFSDDDDLLLQAVVASESQKNKESHSTQPSPEASKPAPVASRKKCSAAEIERKKQEAIQRRLKKFPR